MTVSIITRNFNGVQNFVQLNCSNTLTEITTAGFLERPDIDSSILTVNNGEFDFLPNDYILITYSGGVGLFNFDAVNNTFIAVIPGNSNFTYLPTVSFSIPGDLTVAYTTRLGTYYMLGKVMFVNFNLSFTPTYTTSSGIITISVPAANLRMVGGTVNDLGGISFPAGTTQVAPFLFQGGSTVSLRAFGSTTQADLGTTTYVSGVNHTLTVGVVYIMQ